MSSPEPPEQAVSREVTADEVLAVRPVLRRVVGARVRDPAAVDDLVQDALEHLLAARGRLVQEIIVPYGVVTARNLALSYQRSAAQDVAVRARLVDAGRPEQPDEAALREEERAAMAAALDRLPEAERVLVWAREVDGTPIAELAGESTSAGTMRVRLARSRAKLRVEYLLALRKVKLPTTDCRPALLVLAGGDRGRRSSAATGRHLASCDICSSLSQPLIEGRRGMFVLVPIAILRGGLRAARSHPAVTAIGAGASAAAVAGGLVVALSPSVPAPSLQAVTAVSAPSSTAGSAAPVAAPALAVDGQPLPSGGQSLDDIVGHLVTARGVAVQSVVTRNGFWVGADEMHRVWVQLVGPLRPLEVPVGAHVSFTAPLVAHGNAYAASVGVDSLHGAARLISQRAHVEVVTTALSVTP